MRMRKRNDGKEGKRRWEEEQWRKKIGEENRSEEEKGREYK